MSKKEKERLKNKFLEALKEFCATFSNSVDINDLATKVRHDPIYYDKVAARRVVDLFMSDCHISDNFMTGDVERMIANRMVDAHVRHEQSCDDAAQAVINMLLNSQPETMNVYMPVHGVSISAGQKWPLGHFLFMAKDAFDALGVKGWSPKAVDFIKANTSERNPIVMVPVCACTPQKAREKATEEFQWLENAIRFFTDYNVLGITTPNLAWVENSIVTQTNGILRGTQFQFNGFPSPMPLDKLLDAESIKVISELSDPAKVTTEYRKRIRHAVYLGGLSVHETAPSVSFLLGMTALETLFQVEVDKYVSPSIAQQILEAICFLIIEPKNRRMVFEELRTFYGKRSAIAHGGESEIHENDAKLARKYLRKAIVKLLTDPDLANIQTPQGISSRIKDLKFGEKS